MNDDFSLKIILPEEQSAVPDIWGTALSKYEKLFFTMWGLDKHDFYMINQFLALWLGEIQQSIKYKKSYIHLHVTYQLNKTFDFFYIGLKIGQEFPKCYD